MGEMEIVQSSVEDRLERVAAFMRNHNIVGVFCFGQFLDDDRRYQGITFFDPEEYAGEILFSEGKPIEVGQVEGEARLRIQGFISEVVLPVQRTVAEIYAEGSDLIDKRFDVLFAKSDSIAS